MTDPDSWPILQLLFSFLFLSLCMLYTGVIVESGNQKDIANSGIGLSHRTIASLLLSLPFAAWAIISTVQILHKLGMLTQTENEQLTFIYYVIVIPGYIIVAVSVSMLCCVLPLSWGRARSDKYQRSMRFMNPFVSLLLPLAKLASLPARTILHARGVASEIGSVTEEDVLDLVDSATENEFIDENQKEMIGNIFELNDVTVSDIMTHRTELEAVPVTATVDDITEKAVEFGYSRIPVYNGSLDNIIGIAVVKDFLPYVGKGTKNVDVAQLIRPTLFVPESCRARELLLDFKQKKIQLAVVVDEYGGTAGIVTMEDILESIVGDIEDEYDEDEGYIIENPDGSLTCNGYAEIEDVFDILGLGDVDEDIGSDTIGGLLTDLLERIPKPGEHVTAQYKTITLEALDADERRVTSVLVTATPADADAALE